MVRRIKLSPVRENEFENHSAYWKRRSQILGSVLHWAHDAGACKIEFDPAAEEPFACLKPNGTIVRTELGDTPSEYANSLSQFIRDTIDGHPLMRPFRRLCRSVTKTGIQAEIEIPPTKTYSGSTWLCTMTGETATFIKQATAKPNTIAV
ncbi:MAG: hypothetical protein ACR2NK_17365 [Mariniblastus sp.]